MRALIRGDNIVPSSVVLTDLFSMSPTQMAESIIKQDYELLHAIPLQEFGEYLSKQEKKKRIDHLARFVARFNRMSFWVATEICTVSDLRKRTQTTEFFIRVLKVIKALRSVLNGL